MDLPFVVEAYTAGLLAARFSVAALSLSSNLSFGWASSTFVLGRPRLRGGITCGATNVDVAVAGAVVIMKWDRETRLNKCGSA